MNLKTLFILFIIYSIIGWVLEIFYTLFREKKLVNRGFLIGPYCPIYGIGCILILTLLDKYKDDIIILFVMSTIICSVLEYFTSYILEKKFHARWWDYSDRKFNINGRICLELLIPFGILGSLFARCVNPFVEKMLYKINLSTLNVIFYIILVLFIIDLIISYGVLSKIKISTKKIVCDNTEEITKKVKEYIINHSKLGKRILESFPNLKIKKEYFKKNK